MQIKRKKTPYHIIHLFIFRITGIIFSKRSHENHRDKTNEEYDHHKRVKNTEPMNL